MHAIFVCGFATHDNIIATPHQNYSEVCITKWNIRCIIIYNYTKHQLVTLGAFRHAVHIYYVSQFSRLSCKLYVTDLEACWCTEASAAL